MGARVVLIRFGPAIDTSRGNRRRRVDGDTREWTAGLVWPRTVDGLERFNHLNVEGQAALASAVRPVVEHLIGET
jgi:hypothetical protein